MLEELYILFGGRIAENLRRPNVLNASNDFERAPPAARGIVTKYGNPQSMNTMVRRLAGYSITAR